MKLSQALKRKHCAPLKVCNLSHRNLTDDFFSNGIVSNDHAYVAGWFVTDAHVRKIRNSIVLDLQYKDYFSLQTISRVLNSDRKLSLHTKRDGVSYARVIFYSQQLPEDVLRMFQFDWHHKATSLQSSPHLFDNASNFVSSYIRGVSDGDGSWYFDLCNSAIKWQLSGSSIDFIAGINQLVYNGCNIRTLTHKRTLPSGKDNFITVIHRQSDLIEFGKWMYADIGKNNALLERKRDRYLMISLDMGTIERLEVFGKYQVHEFLSKVQTFEHLCSMMRGNDISLNFTKTFRNRVHLTHSKIVGEAEVLSRRLDKHGIEFIFEAPDWQST